MLLELLLFAQKATVCRCITRNSYLVILCISITGNSYLCICSTTGSSKIWSWWNMPYVMIAASKTCKPCSQVGTDMLPFVPELASINSEARKIKKTKLYTIKLTPWHRSKARAGPKPGFLCDLTQRNISKSLIPPGRKNWHSTPGFRPSWFQYLIVVRQLVTSPPCAAVLDEKAQVCHTSTSLV